MKNVKPLRVVLPLAVILGLSACKAYPTKPVDWLSDRRPTIASMTTFPEIIGHGDSVLVSVVASDPDGDTLVYHWDYDADLVIKADPSGHAPYFRTNAAQVFYRSTWTLYDSVAVLGVEVSDSRGGMAYRQVLIRLSS